MKPIVVFGVVFAVVSLFVGCERNFEIADWKPADEGFIKGADVSFLNEIEDLGGVYTENGVPKDALQILRDHGINFIRLRIWNDPSGGYCGKERTLAMARRIKEKGFKLLLDFHYSDSWADPQKQNKPAAWAQLGFSQLKQALHTYTQDIVTALKEQNTLPDMVQIGNEVVKGILWNDGRVDGAFDTEEQWTKFSDLLKTGIDAVRQCLDEDHKIKIMIHAHIATDMAQCQWFFDHLREKDVDFDVIGLSYYPWWPEFGNLADLQRNLNLLSQNYQKEIVLAEVAYPWTSEASDQTYNHFDPQNPSHTLLQGYPTTAEGQASFLRDLMGVLSNLSSGRGGGFFYWSPEWISIPQMGSAWENLTWFDFQGEVLPALTGLSSSDHK